MCKILISVVPLPWLESCGSNVQSAKADETRDNLSCSICECPRRQRDLASRPAPPVKSVRNEKGGKRRLAMVLTPVTNASRVLSPCVKHRTNDHKTCSDGTFTDSEDETKYEETSKVPASRMAAQSDAPREYVQARDALLQNVEYHAKGVQRTSTIFRQEISAAPNSGETRRRDIREKKLLLT